MPLNSVRILQPSVMQFMRGVRRGAMLFGVLTAPRAGPISTDAAWRRFLLRVWSEA